MGLSTAVLAQGVWQHAAAVDPSHAYHPHPAAVPAQPGGHHRQQVSGWRGGARAGVGVASLLACMRAVGNRAAAGEGCVNNSIPHFVLSTANSPPTCTGSASPAPTAARCRPPPLLMWRAWTLQSWSWQRCGGYGCNATTASHVGGILAGCGTAARHAIGRLLLPLQLQLALR